MAKLYNFLAISLLLALSASLCLAAALPKNEQIVSDFIISPAGENLIRDELDGIIISPTGQKLFNNADSISPAAVAFLDREIDHIARCQNQLSAGRLDECVVALDDALEQKDGPALEDQCCRRIVRVEQGCWDVLFPKDRNGKNLLPVVLDYCNAVVQAPVRAPGLLPSA